MILNPLRLQQVDGLRPALSIISGRQYSIQLATSHIIQVTRTSRKVDTLYHMLHLFVCCVGCVRCIGHAL